MSALVAVLALPPSVNHSHKNIRRRSRSGKIYTAKSPTAELRIWRAQAWADLRDAIAAAGWRRPDPDAVVTVELRYYWGNARRQDTHNRIKEIMDAAQAAGVFADDRQALAVERGFSIDRERPRVELRISYGEPVE